MEQGLFEVLGKGLYGVRKREGEGGKKRAHVDTALYISDLDEIACSTVTDVGIDGKGTTRVTADEVGIADSKRLDGGEHVLDGGHGESEPTPVYVAIRVSPPTHIRDRKSVV